MLTLAALTALATAHEGSLGKPVGPLLIGDRTFDVDRAPVIMGTVNLSRDSTYRDSIAVSTESAIRKARVMAAQGADFVDIGAESSTARASRVGVHDQINALVPVVEQLTDDNIAVSTETYEPEVVRACFKAGARVLNLTGSEHHEAIYDLAAEHDATVILCYVKGANVREISDVALEEDPLPGLLAHFEKRVEVARAHGVQRLVIDPGMGFFYGNLIDPLTRVQHQTQVLLNTFRLRSLGLPICHAMPHAFDLFEDQFRIAEGFFSVLAFLGGTSVYRTHEVANVSAVLKAMSTLEV